MKKSLPADITSYDLLKAAAVILMIADHVGYYFFPDDIWWRTFGRMCVPVWFFLIGYAKSRDLGSGMWIGAGILTAANFISGMSIFPLNIIATIICVRIFLNRIMKVSLRSEDIFWRVIVTLFFLILPTMFVLEYGTQALLLSIFGYLVRNREHLGLKSDFMIRIYLASFLMFVVPQFIFFGLSMPQLIVMSTSILAIMGALYNFRPASFPAVSATLPRPIKGLVKFLGRRTLEIYVGHLILFKFMGLWLEPERFSWFDWKWFSPTGV